jgi:hypothetical protein
VHMTRVAKWALQYALQPNPDPLNTLQASNQKFLLESLRVASETAAAAYPQGAGNPRDGWRRIQKDCRTASAEGTGGRPAPGRHH